MAALTLRAGTGTRVRRWFLLLLVSDGAWALSSVLLLEAASETAAFAGATVWVAASSVAALVWFGFGVVYTGRSEQFSRRRTAVVVAPMLFHVVAFATNPVHGASVTQFEAAVAPVTTVVDFQMGLVYGLGTGYSVILTLSATALVAVSALRDADLYTDQCVAMFVASFAPIAGVVLTALDVSFVGLRASGEVGLVPVTLTVTAVGAGYALFRTELLSAGPLVVTTGRRVAVESLDEGLLIVDGLGRVAEANGAATDLLDAGPVVGRDIEAILPKVADLDTSRAVVRTDTGTVLEAQVTALADRTGGRAITLRDVTERRRRRERLEVLNRVLRHNLRNDLNVVRGFAQSIAENRTGEMSDEEAAQYIVERADGLLDVAENARAVERLLDAEATVDREAVDLRDLVTFLEDEDRGDTDRPVELVTDVPDACRVQSNEAVLELVLSEVLDNAVDHNDSATPTVWLSIEAADDVRIRVADDGPGIPEDDREAVLTGSETSLDHGSRLGLWMVRWGVRYLGGSLSIEERSPTGTVVEIRLPYGESEVSGAVPVRADSGAEGSRRETAVDGGTQTPDRAEPLGEPGTERGHEKTEPEP